MSHKLAKKVDDTVPADRWIASLSNGETIYENSIEDELPAWTRLARYVEENDLSITNLRLQIANTEVKLPAGQEGYIQKSVIWGFSNQFSGVSKCIGYSQGKLSLIYQVDELKGSSTIRGLDPGAPWTIYRSDIRSNNAASI
jgi:hypothetical protein